MRLAAKLALRPVRIGYLVNPTDLESLRKILQINTCLWGGIYNPIIPAFERAPKRWRDRPWTPRGVDITEGYIRFFEPDVLVESEEGLAAKVGWTNDAHSFDFNRTLSLAEFATTDSYGRSHFAAGIDVSDVYAYLYHNEFKFQLRHEQNFALIAESPKRNLFYDAFLGCFPDQDNLRYVGNGYRQAFSPTILPPNPDTFLSVMKDNFLSPFRLAKHGIDARFNGGRELTFFVFDPSDGQDVIDFWNFRQFERRVIPINVDWFAECSPFVLETIRKSHKPLPGNPNGIMIHTNIEFARSIAEPISNQLMEQYIKDIPLGSAMYNRWYSPIWENRDDRWSHVPTRASISAGASTLDEKVPDGDNSISFSTLSPDFLGAAHKLGRATWVNVVQPDNIFTDKGLASVYPTNIKNPTFPRLGLAGPTVISREGWIIPQRYADHRSYLRPQRGRDAFVDWFKDRGIDAAASDAGRVAEQIVTSVGGLRGCAIFANRPTLELLDDMAVNRIERTSLGGKTFNTHFPDKSVPIGRWETLFRTEDAKRRRPWVTLDKFIEASVFRAGLQIKCSHCAQKNWFDVRALDYDLTCARCLKRFSFPQSAHALKDMKWFYRVIGPFATPGYAGGGYAVALTLRLFQELGGPVDTSMTWTTGLDLKIATKNAEIDFAIWCQKTRMFGEPREPDLIFGEAKSFAEKAFSRDDIDRLKLVAEQNAGAYMVASVLKSELSKDDIKKLTSLAKWGRRRQHDGRPRNALIILTGTELFSEWHLAESWKRVGGKAKEYADRASSDVSHLPSLAEMTQSIYLGLPSFSQDARLKYQKRAARNHAVLSAQ
jgi:hypothetical protein